jgi:putative hydrolase of the HAD superfamily
MEVEIPLQAKACESFLSTRMIKAILFDLGDTVFEPDWEGMNKQMVKEMGMTIFMPKEIKKKYQNEVLTGKCSIEDIFKLLIKELKINKDIKDIINSYKKNYEKFSPINNQMLNLIKKLRKNYKILALSNTNSIHKEVNMKRRLFENFDQAFLSFEMRVRKPNKEIFSIILEKTRLLPEEIMFIDDNEKNIKNSKELGFMAIKYENYEKLVNDLKELGLN